MSVPLLVRAAFIAAFLTHGAPSRAQIAPSRQALYVKLDEAALLRLDSLAHTIIIGNPAIADAAVNDGKIIIVTGKSFGTTNLIALDRRGVVIAEKQVLVQPPETAVLTVQRGDEQESYSCSPVCRRAPVLGDTTKNFADIISQAQTRNGLAQSQAAQR